MIKDFFFFSLLPISVGTFLIALVLKLGGSPIKQTKVDFIPIYEATKQMCPKKCGRYTLGWSGAVKVKKDKVECICEGKYYE